MKIIMSVNLLKITFLLKQTKLHRTFACGWNEEVYELCMWNPHGSRTYE